MVNNTRINSTNVLRNTDTVNSVWTFRILYIGGIPIIGNLDNILSIAVH